MKILLLKTVSAQMTSYGSLQWPLSGPVRCEDWDPEPRCGGGLHGLPRGEGDGSLLDWSPTARWIVFEADEADVVCFAGKAKARQAQVVHVGDQRSATDYILAHGASGKAVVGATLTGGDYATLTGGDYATLTGGHYATLTGGDRATLTGGDSSTLTGGHHATLRGGDRATLTGGDSSTLVFRIWDGYYYRLHVAYVGENGIGAGVPYRLNGNGKFVEVTK